MCVCISLSLSFPFFGGEGGDHRAKHTHPPRRQKKGNERESERAQKGSGRDEALASRPCNIYRYIQHRHTHTYTHTYTQTDTYHVVHPGVHGRVVHHTDPPSCRSTCLSLLYLLYSPYLSSQTTRMHTESAQLCI